MRGRGERGRWIVTLDKQKDRGPECLAQNVKAARRGKAMISMGRSGIHSPSSLSMRGVVMIAQGSMTVNQSNQYGVRCLSPETATREGHTGSREEVFSRKPISDNFDTVFVSQSERSCNRGTVRSPKIY